MKKRLTLFRYIFSLFMPRFLGAAAFFSFVIVFVDLMMNLWHYISESAPMVSVATVEFLYLPKAMFYAIPVSILFASSHTLSYLYARNELLAVFASGVPLFTFTLPVLLFSFVCAFALFFFDDNIVVPYYAQKVELQNAILGRQKSLNSSRIVVISDRGNIVYKADLYDDVSKRLSNLFVIVRNDDKTLRAIVRAESGQWVSGLAYQDSPDSEGTWVLNDGKQYTMKDSSLVPGNPEGEILSLLTEPPDTFRNNTVSVETVNAREAKEYIAQLQRTGLPSAEARSVYYKKFSFPSVVFIVVFLSIGLSGRTRKNVMVMSLVFTLTASMLFYVTQMITMLLAKFGALSPFSGAWIPVIAFIALSIGLVRNAKT
ncbi:MAG: LptF/LptG family permease [Treponemataceae bacterium]|nr:MAG: LptF/LptG family permease [Treponemataceae bacterium]